MCYADYVAYWLERAKRINYEIDYSKLDKRTVDSLVYSASNLFSELEKTLQSSEVTQE